MRDGRDGADHAEWGILGHGQPVVAADASHFRNSMPGTSLTMLQLLDLVIEPADLCLFEFQPAQFVGLLIANLVNAGDGFATIGQGGVAELFEALVRGAHGVVDRLEDAPIAVLASAVAAGRARPTSQLGKHLLDNLPNGLFVGLDHRGPFICSSLCRCCSSVCLFEVFALRGGASLGAGNLTRIRPRGRARTIPAGRGPTRRNRIASETR